MYLRERLPGVQRQESGGIVDKDKDGTPVEYAAAHPFLCDEDGERFLGRLLKADGMYIVAACDPKKQQKLLKEGFERAGVAMEGHLISLGTSKMTTEQAFEEVKKAVEAKR